MGLPLPDGNSFALEVEKTLRAAKLAPKVEVINAAVPGYRLVHEFLRFDSLADTYQPQLVVVFHGYQATSLAQAADHIFASRLSSNGYAEQVGQIPPSWPIPDWLVQPTGPFPIPEFLRKNSKALGMASIKILIKLGIVPSAGEGTFYVQNQLRYLRGLREKAAARNIKLLVVTREYLDEKPEEFFSRVKAIADPIRPDFTTNQWLSWPHTGKEDLAIYRKYLDQEFWVVHAKEQMKTTGQQVRFFQKDGMTPTPEGVKAYSARMAGAIMEKAKILCIDFPCTTP
jgi:hypothetical protein